MRMKFPVVAVIVYLFGSCYADLTPELIEEWQLFKAIHHKVYDSPTMTDFRFKIFTDNLGKIQQHNKGYDEGKSTYKMAVNQFTDLLYSEFMEKMTAEFLPIEGEQENYMISEEQLQELLSAEVPEAIDWRADDVAVTDVKDQGLCASGWAFSAIGALEGQHFLKNRKLVALSEQNLMDCTKEYDCDGCAGGWPARAYDYIRDNGGIDTEYSYPYEATAGRCRYSYWYSAATVTGNVKLPEKNEQALKNALATIGPISILINAGGPGFSSYSKGIYTEPNCDPDALNHAALAVGYGSENGQDYWLVKNSWGTTWGEEGYVKIARNNNNLCGVASSNVYPIV